MVIKNKTSYKTIYVGVNLPHKYGYMNRIMINFYEKLNNTL